MQTKLKDLSAEVEVFSRLNQEVLELNSELENLQYELDGTDDEDEQNRILSEIGDLQSRIDDVSTEKENSQNTIDTILSDVAELIREENDQLASIYKLMMSLYMDNVISEMEFIIYLE
jgi:predicted  nucleic acid-binding Zn-ribbon protein